MWQYLSSKGDFTYVEYTDAEGNSKRKIDKFTASNPEAYNIIVLDHLLLLKKERGFSDKEVIDKMSEYMVELRNMFNVSGIFISQFNDGLISNKPLFICRITIYDRHLYYKKHYQQQNLYW